MEQAVRRAVIKPNTSTAKDIFVYIGVSFWGQNERECPAMYTPTTDYIILFLLYEGPYALSTVSTRSPAVSPALLLLLCIDFRLKCRVLRSQTHHISIATP